MRTFIRIAQPAMVFGLFFCVTLAKAQAQTSNAEWNTVLENVVQKLLLADPENPAQPALLQSASRNLQSVKRIAVVHGEEDQSMAFADHLGQKGYAAFVPQAGESVTVDNS